MLLMTGCQSDEIVAEKPTQEDRKRTITFSMNIPDFQVKSRAESETPITKIDLMLFGPNGYIENGYIETVTVTKNNISVDIKEEDKTPKGEFTATIDPATTTIHFIANYDGNLTATPGQSENEVIPNLTADADNIVYWARETGITAETTAIDITFLRHLAKVTVEVSNEIVDGYAASSYFNVTDFVLCNYANLGTIAPSGYEWGYNKNPETITEVAYIENHLTNGTEHSELPDELYLAEYNNQGNLNQQVYVIIAGQLKPQNTDGTWNTEGEWSNTTKYYKVMLNDAKDNPFKIIRNVNYHIIIKQMQDVGSSNLTDAMEANPINNLYAYVMPESPSISDMEGNSLEVTPLVHLLTTGKNIESTIKTTPVTDEFKSGNIILEWSRTGDDGDWLKDISIANGKLTATVSPVTEMKQAEIRIKWGKLSRTVTVIASPQYTITAQAYDADNSSKSSYSNADEDVYFKFNLDTKYPSATDYPDLYPIKCYIRADNLYPVDNKNMLIDYEYESGQYWYTYLAPKTGDHTIRFKTKLSGVNEKIEVESEYFGHAEVSLTYQELKRFTNISWTNLDRYGSERADGTFNFTTENAADEVTVTIKDGEETIYSHTHSGSTSYTIDDITTTSWGNNIVVTLAANGYTTETVTITRNKLVIPAGKLQQSVTDETIRISTDSGKNTNGTAIEIPSNSDQVITMSELSEDTRLYFKYRTSSWSLFGNNYKYHMSSAYTAGTLSSSTGTITLTFTEQ